jgi:hypothetical protein
MSVRAESGSRPSIPASTRASLFELGKLVAALYGSLASLGLLLLELCVVLLGRGAEVSSIWEVQNGALLLLPACVAVAVVTGASGGLLLRLLTRAERSRPHRVMLGLLVATAGALSAFGVGGGRHLAAPGLRLGFALVAAGVSCAATILVAPALSASLRRAPRAFAAGGAAAILLLELVNHFALVRLYPAFHTALAAAALLLAPAVLVPLVAEQERGAARRPGARAGVAVALSLGLAAALGGLLVRPAAQRLARFDNLRLILLESAPPGLG